MAGLMLFAAAAQAEDRTYTVVEDAPGYTRVVVTPEMASPTLPRVREALEACGVKDVHPRTLDALNLLAIRVMPPEIALKLTEMSSVQQAWSECVVMRVLGGAP